ncbi:hypothetical protein K2173_013628 [Erythroxylum novogranatense]|uniref:Small auxin up regulated protein n=1 Tax=Erythroxylum novogranatense TaxID=1862640 RepID=A0AAV8TK14_9ROSI|nr:hypothetical protein K2173_013628 [Erythroxylum novogranatense]
MAIRLPGVLAKQGLRRSLSRNKFASRCLDVSKGFLAVYVGEAEKKRFVVPVAYLNQPAFQDLSAELKRSSVLIIQLAIMAIRFAGNFAKQILLRSKSTSKAPSGSSEVPKGFLAVYVGETEKKRFVVPVSYLNQPSFQDLLRKAEEQFGFDHPMGGLTIPCREDTFIHVTSGLSRS